MLSATVSPAVLQDMTTILKVPSGYTVLKGDLNHPKHFLNLVPSCSFELDLLARLVQSLDKDEAFLVFVDDKMECQRICNRLFLADRRFSDRITTFHAGQTSEHRAKVGIKFMNGELLGLVATAAFEMGIDRPDVALVVLYKKVPSVSSFFQRKGRGGRDEQQDSETEIRFVYDSVANAAQRARKEQMGTIELSRAPNITSSQAHLDEKATLRLEQFSKTQ